MSNNFIKVIPGKKYGMTKGGKVNKKPSTIKRAPALSKPKKMANGRKLVAKSYGKGGSGGCGCGGSMAGKVKSHQQGGVVGQTGTDIDVDGFNTVGSGLFPNGVPAATSSAGNITSATSKQPTIPNAKKENEETTNTTMQSKFNVKNFLKGLKQRRNNIGLNASAPTSPVTPESMYQFGSAKQGGSSMKTDSVGQKVFQEGGVMEDEDTPVGEHNDDYYPLDTEFLSAPHITEFTPDNPIYSAPEEVIFRDDKNTREKTLVIEDIIAASTSPGPTAITKPAHVFNSKGANSMEKIFSFIEGDGTDKFNNFVNFAGLVAQAESFKGEKEYNEDSTASGLFHILIGNGGDYDSRGNKKENGGYTASGSRANSSFTTAKNRMENLIKWKGRGNLDKVPKIKGFIDAIRKASSPDDLTREQQMMLLYSDLKMRKSTDFNRILKGDKKYWGDVYRNQWVTTSGGHSKDEINTNWKNALIRENEDGYDIHGNRRFFNLLSIPITDINTKKEWDDATTQYFKYRKGGSIDKPSNLQIVRERSRLI